MVTVRIMADYECWPVWVHNGEVFINVDPHDLGIDGPLADRLCHWGADYDATLNRDQPTDSGFTSVDALKEFTERGRELARQVAALGARFEVLYRPVDSTATESILRIDPREPRG